MGIIVSEMPTSTVVQVADLSTGLVTDFSATLGHALVEQQAQLLDGTLEARSSQNAQEDSLDLFPSLPKDQLAVVTPIIGPKLNLKLLTIPVIRPRPGEVTVKIEWTGICGSDVMFSLGPQPGFPSEFHIGGHEGIGRVVASHDPSFVGLPVAARYLCNTCRACHHCREGVPESCSKQENFARTLAGTFQEYVTAPWDSFMPVPDWVLGESDIVSPHLYTAALCSGAAALKAVKNAAVRPGDVVVVLGVAGGIGHLTGLLAKSAMHAKVIGVDMASKRDILDHGACDIFVPIADSGPGSPKDWDAFQREIADAVQWLRPRGSAVRKADSVIVTASTETAFGNLCDYVCDGGSIVCVGVPKTGGEIRLFIPDVVVKQIKIRGSLMGDWEETYEVMDHIRAGTIKPVTQVVTLDEVPDAMAKMYEDDHTGKLVVRVGGDVHGKRQP
ncbi:hypothetical protein SBRCBS47491_004958 [Sporothrix bragantina]|uniref:Enoyl reductase (ER) domain-containing protein n=1 Tax=Sporothrix bragantina TaxID=671064 RepID=A0ABP0BSY8_9PEZI